jgi:hypothetical protein
VEKKMIEIKMWELLTQSDLTYAEGVGLLEILKQDLLRKRLDNTISDYKKIEE